MHGNAANKIRSYAEDLVSDRRRLIKGLLIILILMLALILRMHETSKADITLEDNSAPAGNSEICVDIGGAVVKPGVYEVDPETRLYEVIDMAGGLLSNADTDSINRAEYVEDGEKIFIPSRAAEAPEDTEGQPEDISEDRTEEPSESPEAITTPGSGLVNINSASREELKTLSGIGDVKADKIIEYRSKSRFRRKEDIKAVDGIGDSIYNKIKDSITV